MKIKSTILALGLAISSACSAPQQPIPKEILFGNPEKASPALSPDGTKLALLAPDENNVLNVWVDGEKITSDPKRGIRSFLWQYDNQHVLYFQDQDGDENVHLYQTDLQTKETRCLTPLPGVCAQLLAYEPEHPDKALILMNLQNPALFDGYKIDLNTGEYELVFENTDGSIQFVADQNLEIRAAVRYGERGETIVSARTDLGSPWKEVARWNPEEQGHILSFTPDEAALYVVTDSGTETACLVKLNLVDGSQEIVAQDPNYDLMGFAVLYGPQTIVNPISREIEAIRVNREKPEWIVLDPKIQDDFTLLEQEGAVFSLISRDLLDRHWIVAYSADLHGMRYFLYDRETQTSEFLFSAKPKLDQYAFSPIKPISFQARDGMKLHGYLTLPLGQKAEDLPAVLFVHGGPWARDSWGFNPLVQWLANRGYAVLQINFRGSVGYGKEYLNAGNREWAGKMHTDILDGKEWLIDQKIADPEKIAIMGGSYGGYETLVSLTFSPEEFCCGIDIVGPSNLVSLLETVPPYWGPVKPIFDKRIGKLETEREFLESRSPLFKADQICRPLFIVQGANDPRVKQAESDQIVEAMRKNGKEVEYLLIDDEGHGFARPENMVNVIERSEEFLQKHLGQ